MSISVRESLTFTTMIVIISKSLSDFLARNHASLRIANAAKLFRSLIAPSPPAKKGPKRGPQMTKANTRVRTIEPPAGTCPPQEVLIHLPDDISDEDRAEIYKTLDRLKAERRLRVIWSPLYSRGSKRSQKRRLASKPNSGPSLDDYENCAEDGAKTATESPGSSCIHDPVHGRSGNG